MAIRWLRNTIWGDYAWCFAARIQYIILIIPSSLDSTPNPRQLEPASWPGLYICPFAAFLFFGTSSYGGYIFFLFHFGPFKTEEVIARGLLLVVNIHPLVVYLGVRPRLFSYQGILLLVSRVRVGVGILSVHQSINQSVNHSINQSINHLKLHPLSIHFLVNSFSYPSIILHLAFNIFSSRSPPLTSSLPSFPFSPSPSPSPSYLFIHPRNVTDKFLTRAGGKGGGNTT